jgi:histidyl-tRNA synthetase
MIPDAELISLLCNILSKLDVGEFTVKVNVLSRLGRLFFRTNLHSTTNRLITVKSLMESLKSVVSLKIGFAPSLLRSTN